MSRRMRNVGVLVLLLVMMVAGAYVARQSSASQGIRVMTVGSSVAEGWVDSKGGYLNRAFTALSSATGQAYDVVRKAQAGDTSTRIGATYARWLSTVRPQVVVISWGGLDDANAKTPLPQYRRAIRAQIAQALADRAVVLIVTPPVTRASYTQYEKQEATYLEEEMAIAKGFHSPNVVVFDVFGQMKAYLTAHDQTYVPYMADGWHPNSKGHKLGGQLLEKDLLAHYGNTPIQFRA